MARFGEEAAGSDWGLAGREIKSLYRVVAKTVHPDLCGGTASASERHDLMSRANRAYADRDKAALQEILKERIGAGGGRIITFPDEGGGTLFQRNRGSSNYLEWKKVGPARGACSIALDHAARLDLAAPDRGDPRQLATLSADDLQSLFLYDFCDDDLAFITHLGGLEELYLSGARLTDAALSSVSPLRGLKRIYLYQTAISDGGLACLRRLPGLTGLTCSGNLITEEGLAALERTMPRVKTVSFHRRR